MAEKIPMLALSPTMETGTIGKWLKNEGDPVKPGDVLCEVETDKANMEYETQAQGVLLKILVPQGSDAPVGATIAIVGNPGEDISSLLEQPPAEPKKPEAKPSPSQTTNKEEPASTQAAESQKIKATPLARKLAQKYGLNLESITGTGPQGRITEEDVEKAAK